MIDPMELRAFEENNDSDASPTGSGCGYMDNFPVAHSPTDFLIPKISDL
ncbi:MAG: hypothetical protein ACREYE_06445 [Gammaproteobacteria bacterium]